MMITIRDVAKKLGLSITTVSRALDGYADVAAETRELVVRTARDMGYTPNRAARQLRRQRAEAIGYILPADKPQFSDVFFSEFIAGLGDEASLHNYELLVSSVSPGSDAEQAIYRRWVQAGKIDGVILNRIRLRDWRVQYLNNQKKIPFVCLERSLDAYDFIGVESGSYSAMLELIAHLIERGRTRIAYIGGSPELKIEFDRFAGYQAGLGAASIPGNPDWVVHCDLTPDGGYRAMQTLLCPDRLPQAVVCVNDATATGAMFAARDAGLEVGTDIAIAGFDGIVGSAYTQPPLTTLEQPVYAVARQLVRMLVTLIAGEELPEKHVVIQPRLLLRASTGG